MNLRDDWPRSFALSVSYSQIAFFHRDLAQPFSMWTDRHVDQGFAWREGSVSFRTLASGGLHMIEVALASQDATLSPDAVRVIRTPLHVPGSGKMEIASIADAFPLDMPSGVYNLRFECFQLTSDAKPRVRFSLMRTDHPTFAVLRADSELRLSGELLRTASPAV